MGGEPDATGGGVSIRGGNTLFPVSLLFKMLDRWMVKVLCKGNLTVLVTHFRFQGRKSNNEMQRTT